MTKGIWIWGPTGCGKSRWAWQSITNKKVIKAFVISRERYENKKYI